MAHQTPVLPGQSSFQVGSVSPPHAGKARLPRILLIGRDASLLSIRADILGAVGGAVRSAAPEAVSDLVISNSYRVAVFDHSLSDAEAAELAVCTRAVNPRTKLLLVVGSKSRSRFIEALFDAIVSHSELPAALTQLLELIAEKSQFDRRSSVEECSVSGPASTRQPSFTVCPDITSILDGTRAWESTKAQ